MGGFGLLPSSGTTLLNRWMPNFSAVALAASRTLASSGRPPSSTRSATVYPAAHSASGFRLNFSLHSLSITPRWSASTCPARRSRSASTSRRRRRYLAASRAALSPGVASVGSGAAASVSSGAASVGSGVLLFMMPPFHWLSSARSRRPHLWLMRGAKPADWVAAQPLSDAAETLFRADPARAALLTHSGLSLRWPGSVPRCPVNPARAAVAREKVQIRVTVFTLFTPAVFSQVRGGVGGVKTCRVV